MHERHQNKQRYFKEQGLTTERYVIPYINKVRTVTSGQRILEIGCGEGGNLAPFLDMACFCVGVDISEGKIEAGKMLYQDHSNVDKLSLLVQDIYKVDQLEGGPFDIIIMRDVIEHLPNQEYFMSYVKKFLKDDGLFFLGFPPWQNPFGGHQQLANSFLSKIPWIHLLPRAGYKWLLGKFESKAKVDGLLEVYDTGISLDRFDRIVKMEKYNVRAKTLYFINPNYEVKFGLKPRVQFRFISAIPYVKNFFVTAGYYLLSKD